MNFAFLIFFIATLFIQCANILTDEADDTIKPAGVVLAAPTKIYTNAVELEWSEAPAGDFTSYNVFYDTVSGVSNSTGRYGGINLSRSNTSFFLTGLWHSTTYYAKVYTYNGSSFMASNEVTFSTSACTTGIFTGEKRDNMVRIPAGCFIGKDGSLANITHDFFIDTTEVTESLWQKIINDSILVSTKPVTGKSWYEAILFCNMRSRKMGYDTCYTYSEIIIDSIDSIVVSIKDLACDFIRGGFRLPTEDEWEYAYRAGAWQEFYWGKDGNTLPYNPWTTSYPKSVADSLEIGEYAWWNYNNRDTLGWTSGVKAVARKRPNPWSLYDMAGNVEELMWDIASPYRPRSRFNYAGPQYGPQTGDLRILRGGKYNTIALLLCAWYRENKIEPETVLDRGVGFRTVRTAS